MSLPKKKLGLKIRAVRNSIEPEETWQRLQTGLEQIYNKNASTLSFEELYRTAYNLVLYKHGQLLYERVKGTITNYHQSVLSAKILPLIPSSTAQTDYPSRGLEFLGQLKEAWEEHTLCLQMIRDILMYLDRTFVKNSKFPDVYQMGQTLFRDLILLHGPVKDFLVKSLLQQISFERKGELIDLFLMKKMTDMLSDFDVEPNGNAYDSILEASFLEASQRFYQDEASSLMNGGNVATYLIRVQTRLSEEEERAQRYLLKTSLPKISSILEKEFLELHVRALLEMESGLAFMLGNKKVEDLSRLYQLLSRIPTGIDELKNHLGKLILTRVTQINNSEDKAPFSRADSGSNLTAEASEMKPPTKSDQHLIWVSGMLAAIDEFSDIWTRCFAKDKVIQMEINNAFETGINEHPKCAEYISLFIDDNLKRGLKGKSEDEIESLLDKAISLFRFLKEKDIFDRYYKQHLAKRLLLGKSVGEDAERSMISKLKIECGYQFTSKLEGMFNDMRLSADITKDFQSKIPTEVFRGPVLHVSILTSTFWPIASSFDSSITVSYPADIHNVMNRFERFYLSRHSGRKLTWLPNMGNVDIKAQFDKGRKDINISTLCMIVLLKVFDGSHQEPVSFETILNETRIPEPELIRVMQSLSLTKYKILLKSSKGKDISLTDTFKFNAGFTCPLNKIKIPVITSNGTSGAGNSVENDEERLKTLEKIEETRKHQTEAAIVRIMKSRKVMDHSSLVAEVIDQLKSRFSPSPIMVKKRIESLIEREYLDRSKNDMRNYTYKA